MKIRMRVEITGTRDGIEWPGIGAEIVVPDDEGAHLCSVGMAEPIAEPAKAEKRPAAKRVEKRG